MHAEVEAIALHCSVVAPCLPLSPFLCDSIPRLFFLHCFFPLYQGNGFFFTVGLRLASRWQNF